MGSLAMLAWSVLAPCQVSVPSASRTGDPTIELAPAEKTEKLSLATFEPLFRRRFQAPLYDPPPEKPQPLVKEVAPPPPVKLLATMLEPGGGHAMFSDRNGTILIKSVGDEISGGDSRAELTEIAYDHVVLRHEERLITLKLTKE